MDELIKAVRQAFINTFAFYYKAHSFHWNVVGRDFYQLHGMFGEISGEVYGAIDQFAEEIRTLSALAPLGLGEIWTNTEVAEPSSALNSEQMVSSLLESNTIVLGSLDAAFTKASKQNQQGLADFISSRIDAHKKHAWFLNSVKS